MLMPLLAQHPSNRAIRQFLRIHPVFLVSLIILDLHLFLQHFLHLGSKVLLVHVLFVDLIHLLLLLPSASFLDLCSLELSLPFLLLLLDLLVVLVNIWVLPEMATVEAFVSGIEAIELVTEVGLVDFVLVHFRLYFFPLFLMDLAIEFIDHPFSLIIDHHSSLDLGASADIDRCWCWINWFTDLALHNIIEQPFVMRFHISSLLDVHPPFQLILFPCFSDLPFGYSCIILFFIPQNHFFAILLPDLHLQDLSESIDKYANCRFFSSSSLCS